MEDFESQDPNQNRDNSLTRKYTFGKMNYLNVLLQERIEAAEKLKENEK